jgi:hypothetical protein
MRLTKKNMIPVRADGGKSYISYLLQCNIWYNRIMLNIVTMVWINLVVLIIYLHLKKYIDVFKNS